MSVLLPSFCCVNFVVTAGVEVEIIRLLLFKTVKKEESGDEHRAGSRMTLREDDGDGQNGGDAVE